MILECDGITNAWIAAEATHAFAEF